MNSRIQNLILVFVTLTLGVAVPASHARIGDTEQQVLLENLGTQINRDTIDERAKIIVFTSKETQYAVGILDGKVESEVYTNNKDGKFTGDFVIGTLRSYFENWFPVECGADCHATMSDDGHFIAKIGPSKELRKQNVFWIFTDAWRKFAISKKKPAAITL